MRVNNRKIENVREFERIMESLREMGKSKALLLVRRGNSNLYIVLRLE